MCKVWVVWGDWVVGGEYGSYGGSVGGMGRVWGIWGGVSERALECTTLRPFYIACTQHTQTNGRQS
jgi:hypothetical protein